MRVVYFVMRFPAPTQTFLAREMVALAGHGLDVEVRPIWDFRSEPDQSGAQESGVKVVRLGSAWLAIPRLLLASLRELLRRPGSLWRGAKILAAHLPRHAEGWFMTLWGALVGTALAQDFRNDANLPIILHGAWATAPATAAAVIASYTGCPFSFGAHAYDLYRHGGDPLLRWKMQHARFVHTTTQANVDFLARVAGRRTKIVLSRRGLSHAIFERAGQRDESQPERPADSPLRLLSVGRLVEKKGQRHLLAACAEMLRTGERFCLRIVGDGPLRNVLERRAIQFGLADYVEFQGELPAQDVEAAYRWADVFVHAGVVDSQGDRDGLPNVIPEAMAWALPIITTRAGGAAEATIPDETGLIVDDPADTIALVRALRCLANDPLRRVEMGRAGRAWVAQNFIAEDNTRQLALEFATACQVANSPAAAN